MTTPEQRLEQLYFDALENEHVVIHRIERMSNGSYVSVMEEKYDFVTHQEMLNHLGISSIDSLGVTIC